MKNAPALLQQGERVKKERTINMKKYTTPFSTPQDLAARKAEMDRWAQHNERLLAEKMETEPDKATAILRLDGGKCSIEGDVVYQGGATVSPSAPGNSSGIITETLADGSVAKFEYRWVSSADMEVDHRYQLVVNPKRVQALCDNWDPRLLDPVKLAFRGDRYYLIDGQHRRDSCEKLNGGSPVMIFAKVYLNLTQEQEAYLFAKQTGINRKPSTAATINALLVAGDTATVDFNRLTEAAGWSLDLDQLGAARGRIGAVNVVYRYYKRLPRDGYHAMLCMIGAWRNGHPDSVARDILGGFARFYEVYDGQFDAKRLLDKLAGKTPDDLRQRADASLKSDNRIASAIVNIYNYKMGINRLEPWNLRDDRRKKQ